MTSHSQEDLSSENVALILDIIRASGYRVVHYTGRADENLLRGLIGMQSLLEVSVMDMHDRWGTGYAFHYDEREFGGNLPRERPDWLEGILFFQEGAPVHDISLRDWPWSSSDQLESIVSSSSITPPMLLLIIGDADQYTIGVEGLSDKGEWERHTILRPMPFKHMCYDWMQAGDLWIGRWKDGVISDELEKLEENRKFRQATL